MSIGFGIINFEFLTGEWGQASVPALAKIYSLLPFLK
jgi:hypothetical protein